MSQNVEQLVEDVYGKEVQVLSRELGPDLVQVALVRQQGDAGVALLLVTARSLEQGHKAIIAALLALQTGG